MATIILNIFTSIENWLSLYENIINVLNFFSTFTLTCFTLYLTKRIAHAQTNIQAKQCTTERQQILAPPYKAFLEIKQLSENLLYYIGNDLLTIMDEKNPEPLHITRQEIQKKLTILKKMKLSLILTFPNIKTPMKKPRNTFSF